MKKIKRITFLFMIAYSHALHSQFAQTELFSGFGKTDFTFFSSYQLNERKKLSLNTLAFIQKFSDENQAFDEAGVQPTLFWKISQKLSLGTSIYYNSFAGYSRRLSANYTFKGPQLLLVLMSTVAKSEETNASYAEVFAQFQYHKPLNNKLSACFSGQFLTIWDEYKWHSRSYQQLRIGLAIQKQQVGLGIDLDQYGLEPLSLASIGLYYRTTI